jgi:hypothetical protein
MAHWKILPGTGRWREATEGPGAAWFNLARLNIGFNRPLRQPTAATSPFRGGI